MRNPAIHDARLALACSLAVAVLQGCGGGGGGNDPAPTPPNQPPVLGFSSFTGNEDAAITAQLVATDPENQSLTFTRTADAQHGSVTVSASGGFTYTPAPNYSGTDSFTVRVTDNANNQVNGTVNLTVAAVNDAPAITTTQLAATEDTTLLAQLAATDVENQALTFERTADAQHGGVTIAAGGAVTYVPAANYAGPDSFSVRVLDSVGASVTATIAITVAAVNDAPVLSFSGFTVAEDTNFAQQLSAIDADGDAVAFSLGANAGHGTAAVTAQGQLTYRASSNYVGNDTFTVRVTDGIAAAVAYTIAVVVSDDNQLPVANDDEFRIATGAPMTFTPAANDADADGEALTVSIVTQPAGGTVAAGANNVVTFTPANGFRGPIDFQYRVTDTRGGSDTGRIRALIGDFQPILLLSDQLNSPGRRDILRFDGLNLTRLVQSPPAFAALPDIITFRVSGDGNWLFYMLSGPMFDQVERVPIGGAPFGIPVWSNDLVNNGPVGAQDFGVNHDGTYIWVKDRYRLGTKRTVVVPVTPPHTERLLGGNEPGVIQTTLVGFNPADPTQLLLQGQTAGTTTTPPDADTASYSLFSASVSDARTLTQLGGNYPQNYSSGSGYGWYVSGNGRYIYHGEQIAGASPTPVNRSLLVYDTVSQTEDVMYRRPLSGERGTSGGATLSNDGSKVCFSFGDISGPYFLGPAAFHVGTGASPAAAGPVTPAAPAVGSCHFGSDNDTLVYSPRSAPGVNNELFSVTTSVVTAPVQLSHALAAGEVLSVTLSGRSAMRTVVGYRYPPSLVSDLYVVPTDGSAAERLFMTGFPNVGSAADALNDDATQFAFFQTDGSLSMVSTAGTQIVVPITSRPVSQFRWLR